MRELSLSQVNEKLKISLAPFLSGDARRDGL